MNTRKVKTPMMDKWALSCNIYALYGAGAIALIVMILVDQAPYVVCVQSCFLGLLFCGYISYKWLANARELLVFAFICIFFIGQLPNRGDQYWQFIDYQPFKFWIYFIASFSFLFIFGLKERYYAVHKS